MGALTAAVLEDRVATLRRPSGAFGMLALDQRVSLETMFRAAGVSDDEASMDAFRDVASGVLSQGASAILLERGYVGRAPRPAPWSSQAGLILAADDLIQPVGKPAQDSRIDYEAVSMALEQGASALKLLVVWIAGVDMSARVELVRKFTEAAHALGLAAIVEGIVHGPGEPGSRPAGADDLLVATEALSNGADIYKAQVPVQGGSRIEDVERLSRELTSASSCPWVVLSTGVPPERFAELVAPACRGGASGFLAGRALWASAIGAPDPQRHLSMHGLPRLHELNAIVDAEARPWHEALASTSRGAA
jgi:sulfofructosephosphate aldolase